jgi:hypothetical protein
MVGNQKLTIQEYFKLQKKILKLKNITADDKNRLNNIFNLDIHSYRV